LPKNGVIAFLFYNDTTSLLYNFFFVLDPTYLKNIFRNKVSNVKAFCTKFLFLTFSKNKIDSLISVIEKTLNIYIFSWTRKIQSYH